VHYSASQAQAAEVVERSASARWRRAVALRGDLREADAPGRVVAEAAAELGPIDILVNNAGQMTDVAVEAMSDEVWEAALSLHLTATFSLLQAVIPMMKTRRWGRIVNVSTQALYTGSKNHAHYAAAKAGLLGFSFSLAKEVGGIRNHGEPGGAGAHPDRPAAGAFRRPRSGVDGADTHAALRRAWGDRQRHCLPGLPRGGLHYRRPTLHVNGGLVMD